MTLLYGCNPVRGGLQAADDRIGNHLPGPSEAAGSVPIVWIVPGGGNYCSPPLDIVRCWLGSSVGYPPLCGITTDLSDLLYKRGGDAVLPIIGV